MSGRVATFAVAAAAGMLAVLLVAGCGVGGEATFGDGLRGGGSDARAAGDGAGDAGDVGGEAPPGGPVPIAGNGGGGTVAGGDEAPPPPVVIPPTASIFWSWPCAGEGDEGALRPSDPAATVIVGAGEFRLTPPAGAVVEVEIAGRFCAPDVSARDVVLAIDVSNSMRDFLNLGNDPLRGGSCGRLAAVRTVLRALPAGARVALVTFDAGVRVDSGGFLGVAEFTKAYASADVLCARGSGTSYKAALARVEQLVGEARSAAARDVYFVSDGQPNASDDGVDEAERIRGVAALATMIVKGDEALLKDSIASRDMDGNPLHANVRSAEEMAGTIGRLQRAELVGGWVEVGGERLEVEVGVEFRVQRIELGQSGLEVKVEAVDSRGVKYGGEGAIVVAPEKGAGSMPGG